ncbi:Pleiotropic drug resistance ABC transporter protein [Mycena kentingensis (nom. inval.)]|nr:Pleiotropic drug resistance ABC transporter protein [Mycena kentingensis (nom. inval.)]
MELETAPNEPAARALRIFPDASDFTIDGGNFTNIDGGMHFHHHNHENAGEGGADGRHPRNPEQALEDPPTEPMCSESQIYTRNLVGSGRGYPLLIAQPRMNLPIEYRSRGVSIGDVGRVSPEGDFDFFFNIYRDRNHPINHNRVPEDFSPLEELDESDLFQLHIKRGSLSSATVQSYCPDLNATDIELQFACRGPSGAFLALPSGSTLCRLENIEAMRRYAATNAESWYRYVNEKRGRRLGNGRLYLITGWEKAPTGGMATFQNVAPSRDFDIALVPLQQPGGGIQYAFSRGDPARAHTFGTLPLTADGALNHAVFLQGFSISLGQGIIQRLLGRRVKFSQIGENPGSGDAEEYIPFSDTQGSFLSFTFSFFGGFGSGGGNQASASATETRLADLAPSADVLHPSRLINEHLVRTVPDASVIITHDDDWMDALRGNPEALHNPESVHKILNGRKIQAEKGLVFLSPTNVGGQLDASRAARSPSRSTYRVPMEAKQRFVFGAPAKTSSTRMPESLPPLFSVEAQAAAKQRHPKGAGLPEFSFGAPTATSPAGAPQPPLLSLGALPADVKTTKKSSFGAAPASHHSLGHPQAAFGDPGRLSETTIFGFLTTDAAKRTTSPAPVSAFGSVPSTSTSSGPSAANNNAQQAPFSFGEINPSLASGHPISKRDQSSESKMDESPKRASPFSFGAPSNLGPLFESAAPSSAAFSRPGSPSGKNSPSLSSSLAATETKLFGRSHSDLTSPTTPSKFGQKNMGSPRPSTTGIFGANNLFTPRTTSNAPATLFGAPLSSGSLFGSAAPSSTPFSSGSPGSKSAFLPPSATESKPFGSSQFDRSATSSSTSKTFDQKDMLARRPLFGASTPAPPTASNPFAQSNSPSFSSPMDVDASNLGYGRSNHLLDDEPPSYVP